MTKEEKYLQNKIGLINACIAGHAIGVSFVAKQGGDYHYDHGTAIRKLIEKDIRNIFNYGKKIGRQSAIEKI